MRLDDREESENVEDQRGFGPQQAGHRRWAAAGIDHRAGPDGPGGRSPARRSSSWSCQPQQEQGQANPQGGPPQQRDPEEEKQAHFTKVIFGDTERIWGSTSSRRPARSYPKPTLHLFSGMVESACGNADAAVGPFYCPGDSKVYIDLAFYKDMQEQAPRSPATSPGPTSSPTRSATMSSVCWDYAKNMDQARASRATSCRDQPCVGPARTPGRLPRRGLGAITARRSTNSSTPATLTRRSMPPSRSATTAWRRRPSGYVVPDSFTHGTSKQRMKYFKKGFDTGDIAAASARFELDYDQL